MGLYLGSTKIPTISFYKQGGIMPSGIFTIPSTSGTYDVTSYAFAQGDFGYGNLPKKISGDGVSIYSNSTASKIASYAFTGVGYSINMPNVTFIGSCAFMNSPISSVNFPLLTSVYDSAFYGCSNITNLNLSLCTYIGNFAFESCTALSELRLPIISKITTNCAFRTCRSLSYVSIPECEVLGGNTFAYCSSLTSIYCPKITSIMNDAFWYCSYLTSIDIPLVSSLGNYVFEYCHRLGSINLPLVSSVIPYQCFWKCSALSIVSIPQATALHQQAFAECWSLSTISLPKVSLLSSSALASCYNLLSIYLGSSAVVSLANINAFNSTPISNYTTSTGGVYGSIYVPSSLLASYKSATNWATYSDRMVGI